MAKKSGKVVFPPLTEKMYEEGLTAVDTPMDVVKASYDFELDSLDLTLRKGIMVRLPRKQIWELANAAPEDVAKVKIQPGGDGLSFDEIDMHISVPGLLRDELGSLFARAMGRKARGRTSPKKAVSSKENGKKGGRPKKKAA